MQDTVIPQSVIDALTQLEIELAGEQIDLLAQYLTLLLDANARVNLTAIREAQPAWHRLIVDSLTALPGLSNLPSDARIVDVGTGGGLPGLPLAIARPDLQFTLVDATGKKIRLIEQWIETLGLTNVVALQARAETLGQDARHREKYDLAISRAVGPMAVVLEYMLPLVKVGGRAIAMKGPRAERELVEAGDALSKLGASDVAVFDAYPESFENELVLISIAKGYKTPKAYPRSPGMAKQSPL